MILLLVSLISFNFASETSRERCTVVSAGRDFFTAIGTNEEVAAFGHNFYGQLGTGTSNQINSSSPINVVAASARSILFDGKPESLSCGETHCCVVKSGNLTCYGFNGWGKLGYADNGTYFNGLANVPVNNVPFKIAVVNVAVGYYHTCVLLYSGSMRCFGRGSFGRLGYGNEDDVGVFNTPDSVGDIPIGTSISAVCAAIDHTCAISATQLYCFGRSDSGETGYPNVTRVGNLPSNVPLLQGPVNFTGVPVMISCRFRHTAILLDDGRVTTFGEGESGKLGYNDEENIGDIAAPASKQPLSFGEPVTAVSTGNHHTCVLKQSGSVLCFGNFDEGKLGNSALTENIKSPQQGLNVSLGGEAAVDIAAGANFTCVTLASRKLKCFGSNVGGALGYNLNYTAFIVDPANHPVVPLSLPLVSFSIDCDLNINATQATSSSTLSLSSTSSVTLSLSSTASYPLSLTSLSTSSLNATTTMMTATESSEVNWVFPLAIAAAVAVVCVASMFALLLLYKRYRAKRSSSTAPSMRRRSSLVTQSMRGRTSSFSLSRKRSSRSSHTYKRYGNFLENHTDFNLLSARKAPQVYHSSPLFVAGELSCSTNSTGELDAPASPYEQLTIQESESDGYSQLEFGRTPGRHGIYHSVYGNFYDTGAQQQQIYEPAPSNPLYYQPNQFG